MQMPFMATIGFVTNNEIGRYLTIHMSERNETKIITKHFIHTCLKNVFRYVVISFGVVFFINLFIIRGYDIRCVNQSVILHMPTHVKSIHFSECTMLLNKTSFVGMTYLSTSNECILI